MAAATNTKQKQQQQQQPAAAGGEPAVVDPKFEWGEKAGSYVLRLSLQGFRKSDFRVQVDGAGRLTVSGARPGAAPGSLHKVFQLPSTASLDDIAGRFEAGVLTLTVPKRSSSDASVAELTEEVKRSKPGVAKEDGAAISPPASKDVDSGEKKEASGDDSMKPKTKPNEASKKAMDEAPKKAQQQKQQEESSRHKEEQQKLAPAGKKEQEEKPKAPQATAPATPIPEKAAPKPEVANGDRAKAVVDQDQESLAAGVRRRSEEEKAKAAAAAMEAKAVVEKKATACSGWKERVAGGLEQLTDMKWADNVVAKARNNKEVVAIALAAFSIGFFVSQKLFRK